MLTRFCIENFRTFRRLELPRLGLVNLIVGKNNTGKTMLLEALKLYSGRGSNTVLQDLLADREEFERTPPIPLEVNMPIPRFASLFHGRMLGENTPPIRLGSSLGTEPELKVQPIQLVQNADKEFEAYDPQQENGRLRIDTPRVLGLAIYFGADEVRILPPTPLTEVWRLTKSLSPLLSMRHRQKSPTSTLIPASGLTPEAISYWWDSVTLTDAEERIVDCLRILAPVKRISLVERPGSLGQRMVVLKLEGERDPIPLGSFGDGMRKMFGFALGLEAARESKMLLIDEIENGIHYSVHPSLFRFVLQAAQRNDVQVFATTHSWDCVMGFQQALSEHPDIDAVAIRLYNEGDQIGASVLGREDIQIATRDGIDFR